VANRPPRRKKVASIADERIRRAADRIAERYRGKDTSRLEEFLKEQVEAEQMGSMTDVVRRAIEASGLTPAEIGRQAGISKSQLSRFMRGERSMTLETADKLAKVLRLRMVRGRAPRKK
jgi:antitoxin component HigA of HigAB toxin-antitoxin module